MSELLLHIVQTWGAAGLIVVAAGWVLLDSWKKHRETEQWMRDQMQKSSNSRNHTRNDLSDIRTELRDMRHENTTFRTEIIKRVEAVETKIDKHQDRGTVEAVRLNAISKIAPSIHAIINEGLNTCKCDHIAVALLHNGTVTLSGIPYIKFGVVAEKFKPLQFTHDVDLISKYREEDIMCHNRLPSVIVQNTNVEFVINDESSLIGIDYSLYVKCRDIGIKRIAFESIQDTNGLTTGFMILYKFNDEPINMESLHSTTSAIEHLYQNMMASLD